MVSPALCAGGVAAIAVLKGASNATGNVIFTETEKGVHVTGTVSITAGAAAAAVYTTLEHKRAGCAVVVRCSTAPTAHGRNVDQSGDAKSADRGAGDDFMRTPRPRC